MGEKETGKGLEEVEVIGPKEKEPDSEERRGVVGEEDDW